MVVARVKAPQSSEFPRFEMENQLWRVVQIRSAVPRKYLRRHTGRATIHLVTPHREQTKPKGPIAPKSHHPGLSAGGLDLN